MAIVALAVLRGAWSAAYGPVQATTLAPQASGGFAIGYRFLSARAPAGAATIIAHAKGSHDRSPLDPVLWDLAATPL